MAGNAGRYISIAKGVIAESEANVKTIWRSVSVWDINNSLK